MDIHNYKWTKASGSCLIFKLSWLCISFKNMAFGYGMHHYLYSVFLTMRKVYFKDIYILGKLITKYNKLLLRQKIAGLTAKPMKLKVGLQKLNFWITCLDMVHRNLTNVGLVNYQTTDIGTLRKKWISEIYVYDRTHA